MKPQRNWNMKALAVSSAALLLTGASMARPPDPSRYNGFDVRDALVPVERIERGGPPKDGIPAIDAPKFVTVGEAKWRDDDRVLGLVHNGIAKAYPIPILNWHEVVNDRFGTDPIAVTYCPLCGTGVAFDAAAGGEAHSFGVSGLLYNSDVLLYDRASQSLWSQIRQQAISGPLKGQQLRALPLEHTSWADWRARHPTSLVLSTDTGHLRDYGRDPYAGYDRIQRLMFDVEHRDDRYPLKEWVLGVEVNGKRKAYPFSVLERAAKPVISDQLGGQQITVRFDRKHRSAQAFGPDGKPLAGLTSFWFAWVAFYPQTEVYSGQ